MLKRSLSRELGPQRSATGFLGKTGFTDGFEGSKQGLELLPQFHEVIPSTREKGQRPFKAEDTLGRLGAVELTVQGTARVQWERGRKNQEGCWLKLLTLRVSEHAAVTKGDAYYKSL